MNDARHVTPRGFTLVELLIAFLLSSIILGAVFTVLQTSSRNFRIQGDTAQTIDRLSFAMETVKADLRRAGYMTLPNPYPGPGGAAAESPWYQTPCAPPSWPIGDNKLAHGVFYDSVAPTAANLLYAPREQDRIMPFAGDGAARPDRIVLWGNYRSTQTYRPLSISSNSNQIVINHAPEEAAQIPAIFRGAMIAVTSPQGGTQFLNVASAESDSPTTTRLSTTSNLLEDPTFTGANDSCRFTGFGTSMYEVTPLHFVRYSVVNDPSLPEDTALLREELDGAYGDLDPPSRYVVARNVVDFQVWFDQDFGDPGQPTIARDGNPTDDNGTLGPDALASNNSSSPQDARYAYVQLSGRLDRAVARNLVGTDTDLRDVIELRRWDGSNYQYNGDFTRVVTVRGEVELSNFSIRALR